MSSKFRFYGITKNYVFIELLHGLIYRLSINFIIFLTHQTPDFCYRIVPNFHQFHIKGRKQVPLTVPGTEILPPIRVQGWLRWSEPELGEASSVELSALVVKCGQRTLYSPSVRSDVVCLLRDAKSMIECCVPKY